MSKIHQRYMKEAFISHVGDVEDVEDGRKTTIQYMKDAHSGFFS